MLWIMPKKRRDDRWLVRIQSMYRGWAREVGPCGALVAM